MDAHGPKDTLSSLRSARSCLAPPVALDRDLLDAVKHLDEHELRRLHILTQARLQNNGVAVGAPNAPDVKLREQFVKCGKDSCTQCPHGPYWYAHWSEDGQRRSRYIGRMLEDLP